jgi:hypothetical protein
MTFRKGLTSVCGCHVSPVYGNQGIACMFFHLFLSRLSSIGEQDFKGSILLLLNSRASVVQANTLCIDLLQPPTPLPHLHTHTHSHTQTHKHTYSHAHRNNKIKPHLYCDPFQRASHLKDMFSKNKDFTK